MARRKSGDAHKEQRWLNYGDLCGRLPAFWNNLDYDNYDPDYVAPTVRNGHIPLHQNVTLSQVVDELLSAGHLFKMGAYRCAINGREQWTYKASHIARELSSRLNAVVPVWLVEQAQQVVSL